MGRAGIKRRKGSHPQHLAKVGTATNNRGAVARRQRGVTETMGVRRGGWIVWVTVISIVALVVGAVLIWILLT
jgi:hypothetical protein